MERDVVAYDVTTPVTEILDFFRHVTLRRVAIVRDGVPVGVISRGTLLRWIGNWGVLFDRYGRGDNTNGLELLCSHIQLAASTIALEAEQFQHDVVKSAEHAVPCAINAATRLQDQAQDLLALCQVHYQFNPQPSPNPPPSPCGLSSA